MAIAHQLGFPRIGLYRELKWAMERYWKGEISQSDLLIEGKRIRANNWEQQIKANHGFLSVGDFSWYDHVLDMSLLLGVIPQRFVRMADKIDIDTCFHMARGRGVKGPDVPACEMTKWFDTNYHYIVPEFTHDQEFKIGIHKLFEEIEEAKEFKKPIKPILIGPLTYLWLGKTKHSTFDKLDLLKRIEEAYFEILTKIRNQGIEWVQIDEPILVLDLPLAWQKAFSQTYQRLNIPNIKLLLTTYFDSLGKNTQLACQLPTAGLHIDVVRAKNQLREVLEFLPSNNILSVGIVDGRNIWRTDLRKALDLLKPLNEQLKDRLWVASSCSLLHCPTDLASETKLDPEVKSWFAFAKQKLDEISLLTDALNKGEACVEKELRENDLIMQSRRTSVQIHNDKVKQRCASITAEMTKRKNPYLIRKLAQKSVLNLPDFPTTTIGSFPQTTEIRKLRQEYKAGRITTQDYRDEIKKHIAHAIYKQLDLEIDVLVHGEPERNDMVEYFGELLNGFAFTQNGWVQSYGSRCVKPPIIFGDINRPEPMTIEWASYAQSLTSKPVKGMLTGPITILSWSFVRDDQSRFETAKQIALALRDEVDDLIQAGIQVIQIDEPAFREGLPLKKENWQNYLEQAVYCFRLASCSAPDEIQIHTHMCYSEFNDIIEAVSELDADVITIETSRSDMELLKAFEEFKYPNDIGPGVYDIHSPRIPNVDEIINLIDKAANLIPINQLWINPDCGLKTRDWHETIIALQNMVTAAKLLRVKYSSPKVANA